jgi:dienelactone hydrolase
MNTAPVEAVAIDLPDGGTLGADLALVASHGPLVVFAHGSGSSRHSPRNQAVARRLHTAGFGTLLLDLLTEAEDAAERAGGQLRFDVDRLASRLVAAVDWLDARPELRPRAIGYFAASTGAAGALAATTRQRQRIAAIVSRGGRPDLAGDLLPLVTAPTLLIVGGRDPAVLGLNEQARRVMRCERRLEVVPGATHLFEEPGALDRVTALAAGWFGRHLSTEAEAAAGDKR